MCLTGPGQPITAGCERVDFDRDGNVDLRDLAAVQAAFGAP